IRWKYAGLRSSISEPADQVFNGGFFPVHQYTNAVNSAAHPDGPYKRSYQQEVRQGGLPERDVRYRQANNHQDRREERDKGKHDRERRVRALDQKRHEYDRNEDEQGDREGQRLRVLLLLDRRSDGGEEAGIEQVAAQEIQDKPDKDHWRHVRQADVGTCHDLVGA